MSQAHMNRKAMGCGGRLGYHPDLQIYMHRKTDIYGQRSADDHSLAGYLNPF